jgi:type III restriction enzyme
VTEVQPYFDAAADKLAKEWFAKHKAAIKKLSHDRQEAYRQINEMSTEPQDADLVKPEARFEPTKAVMNGMETSLPKYRNHLLCDDNGDYPAELNSWEQKVVETEMKGKGFSFWYRNPQQPGQSSLGISYLYAEQYSIMRPDFIFFATQADGTVVADIVDPHSLHLADALAKLKGLSSYTETHGQIYRRIESVAETGGKLRALDLKNKEVRAAIDAASDATMLFNGLLARDYDS